MFFIRYNTAATTQPALLLSYFSSRASQWTTLKNRTVDVSFRSNLLARDHIRFLGFTFKHNSGPLWASGSVSVGVNLLKFKNHNFQVSINLQLLRETPDNASITVPTRILHSKNTLQPLWLDSIAHYYKPLNCGEFFGHIV